MVQGFTKTDNIPVWVKNGIQVSLKDPSVTQALVNTVAGCSSCAADLNITSTTDATKGNVNFLGGSVYNEDRDWWGFGTSPSHRLHVVGGQCVFENDTIIGTNAQDVTAQLQVNSTTKGFLLPRMSTAQKNVISGPASGLQVYDTDLNEVQFYNGTTWVSSGASSGIDEFYVEVMG